MINNSLINKTTKYKYNNSQVLTSLENGVTLEHDGLLQVQLIAEDNYTGINLKIDGVVVLEISKGSNTPQSPSISITNVFHVSRGSVVSVENYSGNYNVTLIYD